MNMKTRVEQWREAYPKGATNAKGEPWTGEVYDDGRLWFIYQDANGKLYESTETPAVRIDLRDATCLQIPANKAHLGMPSCDSISCSPWEPYDVNETLE